MTPLEQQAYTLRSAGKTQYAIAAQRYEQACCFARRPYHREASGRRKQSRAPILAAARAAHAARRSVAQQMHEARWTNTQIARHFRVSLAAVCRWLARPGLMAATGPLPPLPAPCPSVAAVMAREALPARNAQVCKFGRRNGCKKTLPLAWISRRRRSVWSFGPPSRLAKLGRECVLSRASRRAPEEHSQIQAARQPALLRLTPFRPSETSGQTPGCHSQKIRVIPKT